MLTKEQTRAIADSVHDVLRFPYNNFLVVYGNVCLEIGKEIVTAYERDLVLRSTEEIAKDAIERVLKNFDYKDYISS